MTILQMFKKQCIARLEKYPDKYLIFSILDDIHTWYAQNYTPNKDYYSLQARLKAKDEQLIALKKEFRKLQQCQNMLKKLWTPKCTK